MYKFVDTTEVSEGALLPSEALKINGEYIENQIDGYRTLNVKGREALSPDVVSYTTGIRDGSKLKNKRYPERIITVKFQLIATSNEAFRNAFNKLGAILDVEEAELIFNDEQDKFFIGTPCIIGEIEPGSNSVIGEFEILCTDPFKYSVVEYEAEADLSENSVLIDYNGTYKSYPVLEADFYNEEDVTDDGETAKLTGAGDCGFVAFFTEDEKIIQLGDPDEIDGVDVYQKSQTLINQSFSNPNVSWGEAAKALWTLNNGDVLPDTIVQDGDVGIGTASYAVPASASNTSGTLLRVTSEAEVPYVDYVITAETTNRTATSVKVTVTITASLARTTNYFGYGFGLVGHIYIGGSWYNVTLKTTSDYWRGQTGHTKNLTVTVTGLSATTTSLTGIKFKATRSDSVGGYTGILGETACNNLAVSKYTAAQAATYYLTPTNYGSADDNFHGVTISRTIPADATGIIGATNFMFYYKQKMSIGNEKNDINQVGAFQAQLTDVNGSNIAGVRILKNKSGKLASLIYYLNGKNVYTDTIDLSYNNEHFGSTTSVVETSKIVKTGEKVSFNIAGITQTFSDADIEKSEVTKITFGFEQYSQSTALTHNGLYSVKFIKNNCNTIKDIPNKFSANDVLIADCNSGEIRLNNILSHDLGAIGNDWEDFVLTPGLNQIGFVYSDWVNADYAPTIKVKYREVFL